MGSPEAFQRGAAIEARDAAKTTVKIDIGYDGKGGGCNGIHPAILTEDGATFVFDDSLASADVGYSWKCLRWIKRKGAGAG